MAIISEEKTHNFNAFPDALLGVDELKLNVPPDHYAKDAKIFILGSSPGSNAYISSQDSYRMGQQTVRVQWVLAPPAPPQFAKPFVRYRVDVEHDLKLGRGRVLLFQHAYFEGSMLDVTDANGNLVSSGFNDSASSIVVLSGVWVFYKDVNFQNPYVSGPAAIRLEQGMYPWVESVGIQNDDISSLRAIAGFV